MGCAFRSTLLRLTGFFLLVLFTGFAFRTPVSKASPLPGIEAAASTLPVMEDLPQEAAEPPVQLLLIGHDRQEGDCVGRSDTILLCTLHKQTHQLILTSVLRDLYVAIPGHGSNRINAAYALGGRTLLIKTLEENLGVQPDMCLEVDFSGFAEIIDLLGGVRLTLKPEEAEIINQSTRGDLTAGTWQLNGAQALAYIRIRKLDQDGDFSRTARQRQLLEALLNQCSTASAGTLLKLLRNAIPLVETDSQEGELFRLALSLLPSLSRLQITGRSVPAEGTYTYETIRGMSVLVADLDAARNLLAQD